MRKFLILFLALFMTAGIPMVQAADDGTAKPTKPKEGEKEPERD